MLWIHISFSFIRIRQRGDCLRKRRAKPFTMATSTNQVDADFSRSTNAFALRCANTKTLPFPEFVFFCSFFSHVLRIEIRHIGGWRSDHVAKFRFCLLTKAPSQRFAYHRTRILHRVRRFISFETMLGLAFNPHLWSTVRSSGSHRDVPIGLSCSFLSSEDARSLVGQREGESW